MMSGASMSTAIVSGAVAQLLQAEPGLTPAQVKFVLQFTAQRLEGFGLIEQGAGSLNVLLAVALADAGDPTEAPSSVVIGGEMVNAGELAYLSVKTADVDGVSVWANSKIWSGGWQFRPQTGVVWVPGRRQCHWETQTMKPNHRQGSWMPTARPRARRHECAKRKRNVNYVTACT